MTPRFINLKRKGLWHGGDYNPEQWPESLWLEDMDLMDRVRFDVATVGVFSWASLEPEEGRFEFGWLDRVLDLLASRGKHAVLATPSAAMPAWLSAKHPEILRTGSDGVRNRHGNRVNFCLTSPEYRSRTHAMAERLAERYGSHEAVVLWHVSNEYGGECYCPLCQEAFRGWLKEKYGGDLDELNRRWWTRFWSHTYTAWSQIEAPGAPYGEQAVFGLEMDWRRFVTDQTISFMKNEMEPLRRLSPEVPITTNMMGFYPGLDYPKMAQELDLASWDSYPNFGGLPLGPQDWQGVAMTHDAYRAMKPGRPFLLIESTPTTSNWYPYMRAKPTGLHQFEVMQAVAHGSDGAMYFQWRQSRGSAEMYHGAVVTHAGGPGVRAFEEAAAAGRDLEGLAEIAGTTTPAEAALVYDWETAWAHDILRMPLRSGFPYVGHVKNWHAPFYKAGAAVDLVDQRASLDGYRLVILPAAILLRPGFAEKVQAFVERGGCLIATALTGHVDGDLLAYDGGAPGPLARVLGLKAEEVDALHPSETGSVEWDGKSFPMTSVAELPRLDGAESQGVFAGRFYEGRTAVARHRFGRGTAWWIGADLGEDFTTAFLTPLLEELNLASHEMILPESVTVTRRDGRWASYWFLLNSSSDEAEVNLGTKELSIAGAEAPVSGRLKLPPYGSAVLVERRAAAEAQR